MSKYLNHTELIGSYLEGGMSPDEMLAFENQLHTDPVLRSEFELQQDIVNSLKDFRKSQLKARLDQVPVSMSPTGILGVKTAAAIVLTGIIGIGAYLIYTTQIDTPEETLVENTITVEALDNQDSETISEVETVVEETPSENLEVSETDQEEVIASTTPASGPAVSNNHKNTPNTKEETPEVKEEEIAKEEVATPVVNIPQVIDPSLDDNVQEEELEIPTSALAQEELADNPVVKVETAKKNSELFHYQYYSGKLYLYGDFRDNPYEILELNSASGKKLFMFYNEQYYQILDNRVDLTPLRKLHDSEIIKELDIIKENK